MAVDEGSRKIYVYVSETLNKLVTYTFKKP